MSKIPVNKNVKTLIYTLEDPLTGEIRYIGKTIRTLAQRMTSHIYSIKKENNHRSKWIKSLLNEGRKPVIKVLEECNWSDSQDLEIYWISQFKQWGFNLVNATEGGEGVLGIPLTQTVKDKLIKSVSKEIHQYDLLGNYVNTFSNAVEAAKSLNLKHSSKINACARGERKKAGNFIWTYIKYNNVEKYEREWRKPQKFIINGR